MLFQIHPGDEVPIYRQIIRQVIDAIATGKLGPGERMASHRDLAEQLVISPLTVKKAYDELEREGYIETRRGRGTFVTSSPPEKDPRRLEERLAEMARRLLAEARLNGLDDARTLQIVQEARARMDGEVK